MLTPRVEVIVFNKDNKVLLGKSPRYGVYMFPGGRLEPEEGPIEAARREVEEEAGIGLQNIEILGNRPYISDDRCTIFMTAESRGLRDRFSDDALIDIRYMDRDSAVDLLRRYNLKPEFKGLIDTRIEYLNRAYNARLGIKQGGFRPRVEVVIMDKDGKVFTGKNPRWGHWSLPGGGIDEGESPLEAAKREAAEESGLNIRPIRVLNKKPSIFLWAQPKNGYIGSATTFVLAKPIGGKTPKALGADNDVMLETAFRDKSEAEKMFIPEGAYLDLNTARLKAINSDPYLVRKRACLVDGTTIKMASLIVEAEKDIEVDEPINGTILEDISHSPNPNCKIVDGNVIALEPIEKGDIITINRYEADLEVNDSEPNEYETLEAEYDESIGEEPTEMDPIELLEEDEDESLREFVSKEAMLRVLNSKHCSFEKEGSQIATVGQFLINEKLPEELRDYNRTITGKALGGVLQKVAIKYPEKYASISDSLRSLGDRESTFSLRHLTYDDLTSPVDVKPYLDKAKKEYNILLKKYNGNKSYALTDAYGSTKEILNKAVIEEGLKRDNLYSVMSGSGARGKAAQVTDMIAAPLMVSDYKNRPIDLIIDRSYSQGLTPAQYFAASYGTRRGMISTKLATPLGGYFSKRMGWSMSSIVVTEEDCKTNNGVSYDIEDSWNIGKYLAKNAGKYKKDTIIDEHMIEDLKHQGIKNIIVRSPMTCEADQGICQKCMGRTEHGVAPIGYAAGINSSASISEPVSQGMLSEKHTGGAIKKRVGGFQLIKQLTSIPGVFPSKAILSTENGKVTDITKAPWGGWKIKVNDTEHYTPEDNPPIVKETDIVEKGEKLSEGIINPAEITELRGIGDGRKVFAKELQDAVKESYKDIDRTHYEIAARALVNFGEVRKSVGDFVPGDIGRLDQMKKSIEFQQAEEVSLKQLKPFGIFLAKPILHYFPGTEITAKIKDDILNAGYSKVWVTKEQPPFTPLMIRSEDTPLYDTDWVNRLSSEGLKKSLLEAVHRGRKSDTESNTGFIHPFAYGVTFGKRKIY